MQKTYKRNRVYPIILILISIIFVAHAITGSVFTFINELLALGFSIFGFLYGVFGLFKPYAKIDNGILYIFINPFRTDKRILKHIKSIDINEKKIVLIDDINQHYEIDLTNIDSESRNTFIDQIYNEINSDSSGSDSSSLSTS